MIAIRKSPTTIWAAVSPNVRRGGAIGCIGSSPSCDRPTPIQRKISNAMIVPATVSSTSGLVIAPSPSAPASNNAGFQDRLPRQMVYRLSCAMVPQSNNTLSVRHALAVMIVIRLDDMTKTVQNACSLSTCREIAIARIANVSSIAIAEGSRAANVPVIGPSPMKRIAVAWNQ